MIHPSTLLRFFLTVSLSSLAYHYSLGEQNYWLLMWLAPLPLCLHALGHSARNALCTAFIAFLIGSSASLASASFPPDLLFILLLGNFLSAAALSVVLGFYRYIDLHRNAWAASLVFACGWTSFEFVGSLFSRGGTVASLAYTQTANLPIIQMASFSGIWGVSFLLTIVPAGVAAAWRYRRNPILCRKTLLLPAGFLIAALVFGVCRLATPSPNAGINIGIAAEPATLEQMISLRAGRDSALAADLLGRYLRDIRSLAQSGASMVLLPEKIFPASGNYDYLHPLSLSAQQNNIHLIVGMTRQVDAQHFNSAFVFSPSGETLPTYDKQHLLPPFENQFTPGKNLTVAASPLLGSWGIAICKDMDFVEPAMAYSRQGVQLLLVPALDFHDDAWSHGRVAIMRGVEGNFAVARAGQWGLLTLSDSRGRIVAVKATDANPGETLLLGEVQLGDGKSIYSRLGNWAGWACVLGFACSVLLTLRRNLRRA